MPAYFISKAAAALVAASFCLGAAAQTSIHDLEGEYDLASSTTVPASNWGYAKGRISIRKLDDRHVVIYLACGWKREPKAVCSDYFYAQWRDGGVYLQDMNTDWTRFYFDAAGRKLTIVSRGADAKESVRRDVFAATTAPLKDADLLRRLKREEGNAASQETRRVFGPYSKWDYQNNRIEFQQP